MRVRCLVRQLGFAPQRPGGRARERDDTKILERKTKLWPRIENKPTEMDTRSTSSTKVNVAGCLHSARTWPLRGQTPILTFNFD